MLLHLDTERRLTRLAADAAHIETTAGVHDRPWCRSASGRPARWPQEPVVERSDDAPTPEEIGAAIEALVTGDADRVHEVLTEDAVGWSPTSVFSSRAEAEEALREREGALDVVDVRLARLVCTDRVAVAEWEARARLTTPILVADDVLIEPTGDLVLVTGASIVDLRGRRISSIRSYFDDAALIEQLVLGDAEGGR